MALAANFLTGRCRGNIGNFLPIWGNNNSLTRLSPSHNSLEKWGISLKLPWKMWKLSENSLEKSETPPIPNRERFWFLGNLFFYFWEGQRDRKSVPGGNGNCPRTQLKGFDGCVQSFQLETTWRKLGTSLETTWNLDGTWHPTGVNLNLNWHSTECHE